MGDPAPPGRGISLGPSLSRLRCKPTRERTQLTETTQSYARGGPLGRPYREGTGTDQRAVKAKRPTGGRALAFLVLVVIPSVSAD
jgi:hypothetical protein